MHETITVHKLSEKRKLLGSRVVSKANDKDLGFSTECSCPGDFLQRASELRCGDRAQGEEPGKVPDGPQGPGGVWSARCTGSFHLH